MQALENVCAYLVAHWAAIAGALAGVMSLIGSVKNLLDNGKHDKAEHVLDKVLDVLAFVSRAGMKGMPYLGRLSLPGLPSRMAAQVPPDLKIVPPSNKDAN